MKALTTFLARDVVSDCFAHNPVRRAPAQLCEALDPQFQFFVDLDRSSHTANRLTGNPFEYHDINRMSLTRAQKSG